MDGRILDNPDGTVTLVPQDAWWCIDCGRLRSPLNGWGVCEPCTATRKSEAHVTASAIMQRITTDRGLNCETVHDPYDGWR
jgi:hypothetical protein